MSMGAIVFTQGHRILAKAVNIFHEDHINRMTIKAHFVKNSDSFFVA
jgi:hypothetical protein